MPYPENAMEAAKDVDEQEAGANLAAARQLADGQRWQECLDFIDRCLEAKGPDGLIHARERVGLHALRARVLGFNLDRVPEALEGLRAPVLRYPHNTSLQAIERLLRARQAVEAGDDVTAFRLYKEVLRKSAWRERAAGLLFETLMRRGRFTAARRLLSDLPPVSEQSSTLASQILQLALIDGDADRADQLLDNVKPANGEKFSLDYMADISRALRAERAAGDTMAGIRHIAIAGVSYVGSTVLNLILGSADGFAAAGETQWLVRTLSDSGSGDDADDVSWRSQCRICGESCRCFTPAFRKGLAENPVGWYGRIARQLGVANLVTSDKNLLKIWSLDPLFRFDLIVLYKSPTQQAQSLLKEAVRQHGPRGVDVLRQTLDASLDRWAASYIGHLKLLRPTGRRIVLDWEEFVRKPSFHLRRIGKLLHVPGAGSLHERVKVNHFMGGNREVGPAEIVAKGRIDLKPSNAPALPDDLRERVLAHRRSDYVYRMLQSEYDRTFYNRFWRRLGRRLSHFLTIPSRRLFRRQSVW
jgi:hypothetical protein